MDVSAVSGIRYIWTLPTVTTLLSRYNISLSDVGGMPQSIITMSLISGSLNKLYDTVNTSASYLNVSNNNLTSLGNLPVTMSYINCSNNPILALPSIIPSGLTNFYCGNTFITSPPSQVFQIVYLQCHLQTIRS